MKLSGLFKKLFGAGRREAREVEENRAESFDDEGDVDPFNPFPDPVELEIGDVFDLHSIPPREVRAVVEEYLRETHRKGFPVVRIIHGKGIGVQREIVRSVLARTPFVERFGDAQPDAGGWGATVAFLKAREGKKGADV
jgi:Smr domain